MTVSNFQDQKPVKKEAGITYDFTLLNWLFKDAEVTKAISQSKSDAPVQVICCPPTTEDLDSIYTMTPDIQIAAILS